MTKKPYVIVFGNEKGGTGKSTTAMHILTALLKMGYTVGSLDCDARQGTLTRYIQNREKYITRKELSLSMPTHHSIQRSTIPQQEEAYAQDKETFDRAYNSFEGKDFIIVDTGGNDSFLSRYAHSFADTLITPMNDSFIDLDVLTQINPETLAITRPSIYAEWVWEQKKMKAMRDRGSMDWIVLRNRLTHVHSKNKGKIERILEELSKRLAFRFVSGFSERVIFRELFPSGLTVLDMNEAETPLSLSHIAAKQELRSLMEAIKLPALKERTGCL